MSAIDTLRALLASGEFHHATVRRGSLWAGLWFYRRSLSGFRGFDVAGCVPENDPHYEDAIGLVAGTGISMGAYGRG